MRAKKAVVKTVENKIDSCVYIGPSINGVIQYGTIFGMPKDEVVATSLAVKKYPSIKNLIVPSDKVAEARIKVKEPNSLLNVYYRNVIRDINKEE